MGILLNSFCFGMSKLLVMHCKELRSNITVHNIETLSICCYDSNTDVLL